MSHRVQPPPGHFTRHLIGLLLGAAGIAFAPIFTVLSARPGGVGLWDAAFWRVFFGALAMGAVLGIQGRWKGAGRVSRPARIGWWWLPGVVFAGDFWAWHWSFAHTSVANSTLLANTAILWVTLFAWLVWRETVSRRFLGGALVAFGGVLLLFFSSTQRASPTGGNGLFGDALALLTALFYASYQLSMKYYRRDRPAPLLMTFASAVAALLLLPLALWHPDPFLPASPSGWWPLVALGVVSHAGGQGLIAWALGGLPASLASVLLLAQPVMTALLGVWILDQPLMPWQIAGGAVVVAGLFLAVRGRSKTVVEAAVQEAD
ncbi:MAG: DMT family transporter [Verrucomicrobiales bacterium]|nr:DMT family transporter [Verrucomicrobiales bacterium]